MLNSGNTVNLFGVVKTIDRDRELPEERFEIVVGQFRVKLPERGQRVRKSVNET